MVVVNHVMDIIVNHCQPDNQNVNFSGSDQIQTPQYPDDNPPSPEIKYDQSTSTDRPIFLNDNEDHPVQNKESPENSSEENVVSKTNQEPPQNSDIHQLIEECFVEVPEEQKQNMEKAMLDLVKICHHKQFIFMHDNVDDLIKSALDSKLLSINSINSQRLDKKEQEVKIVEEQPVEGRNRIEKSLQNFRVIHKSSISLNTSQISLIHEVAPILSTKEPENSLKDKRECDELVCDNHSDTFSDSKIDDDILVYDDDFEDIEHVEALLPDPEIVSIEEENGEEEENVVQREEEEVDLEDISQVQDVDLREKLFSITRLISNIESLNDNSTPDRVFNSFESDNSLLDNYSPKFETFCDHSEETRSGNTAHANYSLPEYDSFCFEIEPDQERLINLVENDIPDNSSNDHLLEEADLFLDDNPTPPGIENFADDPEGDIHFLEELLIEDSILYHESFDSNFEDNPSILRPPLKLPDAETDVGEEIAVVMNDKDKFDDDSQIFMFDKVFSLLSAESEDTIFDPGRILKNLLDRVSQLHEPFSLQERLKADNKIRVKWFHHGEQQDLSLTTYVMEFKKMYEELNSLLPISADVKVTQKQREQVASPHLSASNSALVSRGGSQGGYRNAKSKGASARASATSDKTVTISFKEYAYLKGFRNENSSTSIATTTIAGTESVEIAPYFSELRPVLQVAPYFSKLRPVLQVAPYFSVLRHVLLQVAPYFAELRPLDCFVF
nr:polyprotein, putative [Tanacetum cinerariifolium]